MLYGYRYALSMHADWIFQTDSDGQKNPEESEAFWQAGSEYDAVIGNRSARQDGASRIFVEKVLLGLLHVIFGVKMPDSNAPFRLMRASLVEKYLCRMPARTPSICGRLRGSEWTRSVISGNSGRKCEGCCRDRAESD